MSRALAKLEFPAPVAHVYDPLTYAWAPYEMYVTRYGLGHKRVVLLGMNPGPFGMMQTGVPFGEVAAVRDWMGIAAPVQKPKHQHPKRPIEGLDCPRSEVSGRRLWGWAARRFGTADAFFSEWFVLNYCPLALLEESGRNFTPDKLPAALLSQIYSACDRHLAAALTALTPEWAIGIGGFAEKRIRPCWKAIRSTAPSPDRCTSARFCIRARPVRSPIADGRKPPRSSSRRWGHDLPAGLIVSWLSDNHVV